MRGGMEGRRKVREMKEACKIPAHDVNALPESLVFFHSFSEPRHQSDWCHVM